MPINALVIYLLVAVIYVLASIKRLSKEERLIYFKAGKPTNVAGPGVLWALPGFQQTRQGFPTYDLKAIIAL
jgi:regulator of protease activity HflC (stomatin/prohibitin superfamily)